MKNLARLILFFSVCFGVVLLSFGLIKFLHLRIDGVRFLPTRGESPFPELINSVQWALPIALYLSLLLSLSYTAKRNMSLFLSLFCLALLAQGLTLGVSEGILRLKAIPVPPAPEGPVPPGGPGLILSLGDTTIVLMEGPSDIRGPRVVSIAGRPLAYQETPLGPNNIILGLPPIPFRDERSYLLSGLIVDFSLSARQFEDRRNEGLIPLLIYTFSLIFLLVSLRFVLEMSRWPLANLCLGAVVFRGVLTLETFLNARETAAFFESLPGNPLEPSFFTPVIFCALALIVLFYTGLNRLAKGRRANEG
ncbi:MAG: hypothetical protein LBP42_02515 [Treponema sp.]|jgi:hypothetical protein|nr:hypothetical protein [Treponema sp.]